MSFNPAASSAIPKGVVPKRINNPNPATIGGKAMGKSRMIFAIRVPKKRYRAMAYAVGMETAKQSRVDIIAVSRPKRKVKRISSL